MPRTTLALTSFVSGEFGNKLTGRTDFEKYSSAAKTMENFLVHPQGAATRRVGTQYIASVKTASLKTRLIPFEFSTTQTYILEFGNTYIRFYKDKGQILDSGSAYEISSPYLTAELFDIKFAQSADVMYITHPNHEVMKLSRTGHTSWTLTEVVFVDGPYLAENTTAVTMTPGATTGDDQTLTASSSTFASTDVGRLINFSDGYAKVRSYTSGTVVKIDIKDDFSGTGATATWKLGAFSDTTGHPSCVSFFEQRLVFAATTGEPQTIYFSKAGDYENFLAGTNDADSMIYTIAANQVNVIRYLKAQRTLVIGTTAAEYTVSADGTDASITPSNITIKRQSSYGSANVDAITAGNAVLFLQKAKRKIRELAYNFDTDSYVAPDLTILNDSVTKTGITQMEWQQEPDNILWCVRDDGQLAALTYQRSENVVSWHRHIIGGIGQECTITVSDYANIAAGTKLIFTKSNGEEVTFTCQGAGSSPTPETNKFFHNESNDTTADNIYTAINLHADFVVSNPSAAIVTVREASHSATGFLTCKSFDTTRLTVQNESAAVVESIASISGTLNEDELWIIVKRVVDGSTVRYIEVFSDFDFDETDSTAFKFLDSHLTYSGSSTSSLSGLSHLEGQTVSVLADGSVHDNKVVSSGAITLDRSVTSAVVGLAYNSVLQTMRIEGGAAEGTSQGKTKRISKVVLRLFETVGVKVGPSLTNLEQIPFRTTSSDLSTPVSTLIEGDKEIEFNDDFNSDGYIFIKQEQPLPCSLLAIYPTLVISDG
jgi:hypothetical protein